VRCLSSVPNRLSNVKSAAAPAAASAVEASSAAGCSISPAPPASSPTHLAGRLRCGLHHQARDSVKWEAELHSIAYRYTGSFAVEFHGRTCLDGLHVLCHTCAAAALHRQKFGAAEWHGLHAAPGAALQHGSAGYKTRYVTRANVYTAFRELVPLRVVLACKR